MKNTINASAATINQVIEALKAGHSITIHTEVGSVRKNCLKITEVSQIPEFLIKDGSVVINEDGTITMHAIECPATRSLPVYLCWEEVSEEKKDLVPGEYGSWSKDNGDDTLDVIDGVCYNKPAPVMVVLMGEDVPAFVQSAGFPVVRNGKNWELTRTDWNGEVRIGTIGEAFWAEYKVGDVNILGIHEKSIDKYIVSFNGEDICTLRELVQLL